MLHLPAYERWKESFGGTPTLWDYLAVEGGATLALAFAELFCPRLIEVRGCILLEQHYEASRFEEWWANLDGDIRAIELVINHIHIWDLFDQDEEELPEVALLHLAQVLAMGWRVAVAQQYPDRRFEVTVTEAAEEYGPTIHAASVRE